MKVGVVSLARRWRARLNVLLAVGAMLLALALPIGLPSAAAQPAQRDLVDTVRTDAQFSTLARAIEVAGLVDILKGPGPYTLYAPTNQAFEALAPGALDALLRNPEDLRQVLTYHVAPGVVTSAQAIQAPSVSNIQGKQISVNITESLVRMNGSAVIQADVPASNGIIHVVDGVWLVAALNAQASNPQALPTAGTAENPFSTALAIGLALIAAGLVVGRVGLVSAKRA